jgi:hypothetical protein
MQITLGPDSPHSLVSVAPRCVPAIPIAAGLVAAAHAFDAPISERVYK